MIIDHARPLLLGPSKVESCSAMGQIRIVEIPLEPLCRRAIRTPTRRARGSQKTNDA
jgi:hypothetical protein